MSSYVVIGLGNLLLCDDTIGPLVVRNVEKRIEHLRHMVDIEENDSGGLDLLDLVADHRRVVIVDSIVTGTAPPGTIHRFSPDVFHHYRAETPCSLHGLNLPTLFEMGRRLGYDLPEEIVIFGIEASDVHTFSETPTTSVKAALDDVGDKIMELIDSWILQDGFCKTNHYQKQQFQRLPSIFPNGR